MRDAVAEPSDDPVLNVLIELALIEVVEGTNVLGLPVIRTPVFWRRYMTRWVREALEEEKALLAIHNQ